MQKWNDEGFLIQHKPWGEHGHILTLLTHHHGKYSALLRAQKACPPLISHVQFSWQSRLAENLGYFKLDDIDSRFFILQNHGGAFQLMQLMCLLCHTMLPERISMPAIYCAFQHTLSQLCEAKGLVAYNHFEALLLEELGYSLSYPQDTVMVCLEKRQKFWARHSIADTPFYHARQQFLHNLKASLAHNAHPKKSNPA